MAEINKQDLITPEAADTFKDLTKDATEFKSTLDGIRQSSKTFSDSINDNNTTATKMRETVTGLSDDQKELNKIQNQIAIQNARLTDTVQAQIKAYADVKEQVKLKTELGDREAISITRENASRQQLGVALAANQKAYSLLITEQQRQTPEGQKLLKVIQDQFKGYDELSKSIGINKQAVGGYTEAIEKAAPAFRALNPQLVEAGEKIEAFGKKALALLLNPVVLIIAAIVLGLAAMKKALDAFTEGTIEGADRANTLGRVWGTIGETITGNLKKWGKSISDFLESTLIMLTQIIPMTDEFKKKLDINTQIAILQNEIKKEEIKLITESAKLELEKEEELNAARDKSNRSLQERYEALQRGDNARIQLAKLHQKEAQKDLELVELQFKKIGLIVNEQTDLNELFKNQTVIQTKSYGFVEELAKAQKKVIDAQKEEFEGTRRNQAMRSSLNDEQIKLIQDAIKEERDAQVKLNEELVKTDQAKNARILANQSATLEEKITAETHNMLDLESLNDKQTSDELLALREKGLQEIILDKEANEKINAEAGNNLKLRSQLILAAKNKEFDEDARFQNEVALLLEAGAKRQEEIVKKSGENIVKLILDRSKQVAEINNSELNISKDEALANLNKSLEAREISIIQYERRRKQIELAASADALELQNGELQHQILILSATETLEKQNAQTILKLKEQIAKNEVDISDKKTERLKANLKEAYNLEKQLANQTLDTIKTIGDNQTQAKIQVLEDQLSALQENEQKQITLAGNNEEEKRQISLRFAAEQAKIRKQEAKLKHDQAVKDKQLDEAKIIINTAVAISEHLANPIAVAIIAALGSLELAKVESTPIPAYYLGTENHPGGKALVGEQGTELLTMPSGQLKLTPNRATVMDLPAGTEVLPNKETMKVLALAGLANSQTVNTSINQSGVINAINGLRSDMKKQKTQFPNYARMASGVYEFRKESDTHIKKVLALSGNH